jgi:hypothetical protein
LVFLDFDELEPRCVCSAAVSLLYRPVLGNYNALRSTTVKNNVPVDDKLFDKPKADPKK